MLSHYLRTCLRPGLAAGAVALALTLLLPVDGAAQHQQPHRVIITDLPISQQVEIHTLADVSLEEAEDLLAQAKSADESTDYLKAGDLYEQSGQLRTPGDKRGVEAFEAAGLAYFNADEPKRASRMWEEAANRTLVLGDVYRASVNYMRAAVAAHADGSAGNRNRVRVNDMGWKAYHLTQSPQLTRAQKRELRKHITTSPVSLAEAENETRLFLPHMRIVRLSLVSTYETMRLRSVETRYRALRDSLAGRTPATPTASERVKMMETIHFGHDRSDLSSEAKAILRQKVAVFNAHPSMRITITGYTSSPGTGAYNQALGLRRANAARDYLVSQGVAEDRIHIATRGEKDLIVGGPDAATDAANRRGEFTIMLAEVAVSQR